MSLAPAPAGYSGKSVIAKIGLKPGQALAVVNPPPQFNDLVKPLPQGARVHTGYDGGAEVVWVFVRDRAELDFAAPQVTGAAEGAAIWISWRCPNSRRHWKRSPAIAPGSTPTALRVQHWNGACDGWNGTHRPAAIWSSAIAISAPGTTW